MEMGSVQHQSLKILGEGMGYPGVQAFFWGPFCGIKRARMFFQFNLEITHSVSILSSQYVAKHLDTARSCIVQ
jgi:hypothetical protein